jgi:hypothetical protein
MLIRCYYNKIPHNHVGTEQEEVKKSILLCYRLIIYVNVVQANLIPVTQRGERLREVVIISVHGDGQGYTGIPTTKK